MRQKWVRHGLRAIGPLVLVVVLWKVGDPTVLLGLLRRMSVWPLVVAVALNAANLHLKVMRTQLLCGLRGHRYPMLALWRGLLPSLYFGMITPGRVGDALRVQYMRRDLRTPYAEGLGILVMDRFCDLYVLLGFAAAGIAHFATILTGDLGRVTWMGVLATALLPLMFFVRGPADVALRWLLSRFPDGGGDAGGRFLAALRGLVQPRLGWAVVLTTGAFLVNYLQGWLLARGLGLDLGYAEVSFLMAITSLLGLLPISMSGAGVRELFLALAFPALGLVREQGVAFGLVIFAAIYVACSLAGFIAWQVAPPPFGADVGGAEDVARSSLATPRVPGDNRTTRRSEEP